MTLEDTVFLNTVHDRSEPFILQKIINLCERSLPSKDSSPCAILHHQLYCNEPLGAKFFQGLGRKQNFDASFGLELVQYMVQYMVHSLIQVSGWRDSQLFTA